MLPPRASLGSPPPRRRRRPRRGEEAPRGGPRPRPGPKGEGGPRWRRGRGSPHPAHRRHEARPAPPKRRGEELRGVGVNGPPGPQVEEGEEGPKEEHLPGGSGPGKEPGKEGGKAQKPHEHGPPPPALHQEGRHEVARHLGQGDEEDVLQGAHQGVALGHEEGGEPDEGPVVARVQGEPGEGEEEGAPEEGRAEEGPVGEGRGAGSGRGSGRGPGKALSHEATRASASAARPRATSQRGDSGRESLR